MKQDKLLSIVYLLIALMLAGLPPFSGFLGKVFILQATAQSAHQGWIIAIILIVSLLSIIALTRVGFVLFWRSSRPEQDPTQPEYVRYQALPDRAPARNNITIYVFLSILTAYVVFASPIQQYTQATAEQIRDRSLYVDQVLKKDREGQVISIQAFDPTYLPETKYGGEAPDANAHYIPYVVSPNSLNGEHISSYKLRQIEQQLKNEQVAPSDAQLKPMEQ